MFYNAYTHKVKISIALATSVLFSAISTTCFEFFSPKAKAWYDEQDKKFLSAKVIFMCMVVRIALKEHKEKFSEPKTMIEFLTAFVDDTLIGEYDTEKPYGLLGCSLSKIKRILGVVKVIAATKRTAEFLETNGFLPPFFGNGDIKK